LHSLLEEYLKHPERCLENVQVLEEFIKTTQKEYSNVVKKLEAGRDILIELNSFNESASDELLSEIKNYDDEATLPSYMSDVFQELGVDIEDLSDNIFYIKPSDNMYIPHFPGLDSEGVRITYDRKTARLREDVEFLTWDHPMVVGVMDLILSNTIGNATVMMRKKSGQSKTFIEAYFKLYAVAPKNFSPDRFFPPTSIRVLVDNTGEDFSDKWSKADIDERAVMADSETVKKARTLPKQAVQKVLNMAHQHALNKSQAIKESYKKEMIEKLSKEKERLLKLKEVNPVVRTEEIDALSIQMIMLTKSFNNADVVLDSVRVIF
jgi:ATP-dependent helicase HepA